jgi:nitrite reductase/ring-hydroxylating ferredoxin subunit/uncharacterized membrane protein
MASEALMTAIDNQPFLDQASDAIQPAINDLFTRAGETGLQVKDLLHGTWLGHPLHPVLTDVPLGAWTAALVLDAGEAISGNDGMAAGADAAIAVGLVGAVGAAVTGVTDWSATNGRPRKIGLVHGLLNVGAAALYATSLVMRRKKKRQAGVGLAMLGYALSGASAYLGGHLVYREQIGVNHALLPDEGADFVTVIDQEDLQPRKLTRADANEAPVLLVKDEDGIYALGHTCSHQGGPLSEGKLEGQAVTCPWHGSTFSIKDGSVIHGPATFPQPCFETRVVNGRVQVKPGCARR